MLPGVEKDECSCHTEPDVIGVVCFRKLRAEGELRIQWEKATGSHPRSKRGRVCRRPGKLLITGRL